MGEPDDASSGCGFSASVARACFRDSRVVFRPRYTLPPDVNILFRDAA
jgi:hypothetical protein